MSAVYSMLDFFAWLLFWTFILSFWCDIIKKWDVKLVWQFQDSVIEWKSEGLLDANNLSFGGIGRE